MSPTGSATDATVALITRFENNFNTRDIDAIMRDMTDDAAFEHVAPEATSFGRHEGQAAVRAVWESLEDHFPGYSIDVLDVFAAGDRAACRYIMRWKLPDGGEAMAHGVDLFTVRGGKIAEKLTFVAS